MWTRATVAVVLALAGCGGDDEQATESARKPETATTSTYASVPEEAADDAASCIELWNAFVRIGDAGQKSAIDEFTEFVEAEKPDAVIVAFAQGQCAMLVPSGDVALEFVAKDGRGPWYLRGRADLEKIDPSALPEPNARPAADGLLTPAR